ncbi:MAG: nucleotide exchange factor GrpE [Actinobacteria bacterium]|nr:nucleotide exchange factor GrpE [Actinomycetota bacterium]
MEDKKNGKKDSGNGEDRFDDMSMEQEKGYFKAKKKLGKRIDGYNSEVENEIKELREEIQLLRKELTHYKKIEEEYLDRLKRVHADYDNYRKRVVRDQIDTIARANKDLIEKILPVIDSFEHALSIGEDLRSGDDEFYKGVVMIFEQLIDILKKEGVTVIDPRGEEFNPQDCEAAVTEDVEDKEEGTILEVLRKGYRLNDNLIRPAVVKVCKKN